MYWLNGERQRCIDVSDRGFQYGDGLFETIEILHGKPLFLDLHLNRLFAGCTRLLIPMPDYALLQREAENLAMQREQAVMKLIITRGTGGRGYRQPDEIHPTRLFSLHPFPDYPENFYREGVSVRFCQQRLGLNPSLAGIKHLNRLEQVLGRAEWLNADIQEGLMLDMHGNVIEGTMSNVFYVKDRVLYTSLIEQSGVAGIVRAVIIDLAAQLSIETIKKNILPEELLQADEMFVTNSIIGIWPVRKLDRQDFVVGPITQELHNAYLALKQSAGSSHD